MQGSTRIDELRQKFHENPRRYFAPLANEYRKAGDPEQAIAICRAHLAQQPGHMSGHVVYGQALYDAQRPDEARAVFEKALTLDPDNAIVLRHLGNIAREKGEVTEARHWYTRALDVDSLDTEVAAYLAELEEPVSVIDAAVEEQPAAADEVASVAEAPVEEPQVAVNETSSVTDEPAEDVAWRRTPKAEQSPFITRTMAELYAQQGHRDAALDVYRQLALRHPDDAAILERIEQLSASPGIELEVAPVSDAVPHETAPQESLLEKAPPEEAPQAASAVVEAVVEPPEAERSAALAAELDAVPREADIISDGFGIGDSGRETVSSSEESLAESDPSSPADPATHFTEMELSKGDEWDADSWAAGFRQGESVDLEFAADSAEFAVIREAGEVPQVEAAEEPAAASSAESELPPELPPEESEAPQPEAEPVAASVAPEVDEPQESSQEPVAVGSPEDLEPPGEDAADEARFVAYSPELPSDEELPHFTPKGPTVREFFAALGARKPPSRDPHPSYTARGAIPSGAGAQPADDELPLATDAFADLFPSADVSEEDTRAAFALTGALSSTAHTPGHSSVRVSTPPPPAPDTPIEQGQESEEDIRRFREWLDGLAES
jgi:tetratricopeptide (TPR) repeat protein